MRFLLALPALVLAGGLALADESHGGKVDWVRDPAVGFAKAKVEGRASLLYFSATW